MNMSKIKQFHLTRVLLARPQGSQNIGACCRAMKNMGFSQLSIIKKCGIDLSEVRTFALSAFDIYEKAQFFDTMESALADSALVLGTTRRIGKRRKAFSLFPEEAAQRVLQGNLWPLTIVFGNEETGLSQEELDYCHYAVQIPTSDDFPSINLSHALQIVLYAFSRVYTQNCLTPVKATALEDLQPAIESILDNLQSLGFFKIGGKRDMKVFLTDICARAGLSIRETRRFSALFQKIEGLCKSRYKD
ncbi:MAG: RNA methyltransferase [Spirochaetales bacterium]|nr:RNA methyltransferase [Spirochaetales bacterium]